MSRSPFAGERRPPLTSSQAHSSCGETQRFAYSRETLSKLPSASEGGRCFCSTDQRCGLASELPSPGGSGTAHTRCSPYQGLLKSWRSDHCQNEIGLATMLDNRD